MANVANVLTGKELDESDDLFSFGGYLTGSKITVKSMTKFLEKNHSVFELLVNEHIKKFENL